MQRKLVRSVETIDSWFSNPIQYYRTSDLYAISDTDGAIIRYSFENSPMLAGSLPFDMFTIFQSKNIVPGFRCVFNVSHPAAQAFVEQFKNAIANLKLTKNIFQLNTSSIDISPNTLIWDLMIRPFNSAPRDIVLVSEMRKIINLFLETSGITDEATKEMVYADMEDRRLTLRGSSPIFSSPIPIKKDFESSAMESSQLKR